jgi:hypothetical protein
MSAGRWGNTGSIIVIIIWWLRRQLGWIIEAWQIGDVGTTTTAALNRVASHVASSTRATTFTTWWECEELWNM